MNLLANKFINRKQPCSFAQSNILSFLIQKNLNVSNLICVTNYFKNLLNVCVCLSVIYNDK